MPLEFEIPTLDINDDAALAEVVEEFVQYGLYEDIVNMTNRSLKVYD